MKTLKVEKNNQFYQLLFILAVFILINGIY